MTSRIQRTAAADQADIADHRKGGCAEKQFGPGSPHEQSYARSSLSSICRRPGSRPKCKTARLRLSQASGFAWA